MDIILFETPTYKNLLPLVYFRPVWELRCGALTLQEKMAYDMPQPVKWHYLARTYLMKYYLKKEFPHFSSGNLARIFIAGNFLSSREHLQAILHMSEESALVVDDTIVAFKTSKAIDQWCNADGTLNPEKVLDNLKPQPFEGRLVRYLWDAIDWNGAEITADLERVKPKRGRLNGDVAFVAPENIFLGEGVHLKPGVVLDAEEGPIWIDNGAKLLPNSVIMGPVYIGKNSLIKIGAKIYENTSIGPVCKIGGEVEESIVHSYSNKQHDGFLGHSYLGSWVNLGADTNNSDLKNNYGLIRVYLNGYPVETGKRFLGLMMGDHSKCAINTMFNTGTIVGVNCNIFGAGMPPKFVPSFSWGGADGFVPYDLEKAMKVAEIVMGRRHVPFTEADRAMFQAVWELARQVEKKGD